MKLLAIGILTAVFWLTGCDSSTHSQPSDRGSEAVVEPAETLRPEPLKQVILTMGSWRKDDVEQMAAVLKKFTEQHPQIVIKFDPTEPVEYNDVIKAQLQGGTAPDLFYLRSHYESAKLYHQGNLERLNDLPGIGDSFPETMLNAWTTPSGDIYGVPLMAVSHGIYYNADFFREHSLAIPQNWPELVELADTIQAMGVVPFANATGDSWTPNGLIFQNLIPGFIGGEDGRLAYYNGERCFNDDQMVAAYQAVQDVSRYLSPNYQLLKYADSLQIFLQAKAPMWFGGSWDIPFFEAQSPGFDWQVFAIPPPAGKEHYVTFHPDAGIGLNSKSAYIDEARLFLEWMTTEEFAVLFEEQLPGFFPIHKAITHTENVHANMFLQLHNQYKTASRIFRQIEQGSPSDYEIAVKTSMDVMNGVITPQQAADLLQAGIASWYEPAANCMSD